MFDTFTKNAHGITQRPTLNQKSLVIRGYDCLRPKSVFVRVQSFDNAESMAKNKVWILYCDIAVIITCMSWMKYMQNMRKYRSSSWFYFICIANVHVTQRRTVGSIIRL